MKSDLTILIKVVDENKYNVFIKDDINDKIIYEKNRMDKKDYLTFLSSYDKIIEEYKGKLSK